MLKYLNANIHLCDKNPLISASEFTDFFYHFADQEESIIHHKYCTWLTNRHLITDFTKFNMELQPTLPLTAESDLAKALIAKSCSL
jgi:hypothetical protein